jgi:hypothetical protein
MTVKPLAWIPEQYRRRRQRLPRRFELNSLIELSSRHLRKTVNHAAHFRCTAAKKA